MAKAIIDTLKATNSADEKVIIYPRTVLDAIDDIEDIAITKDNIAITLGYTPAEEEHTHDISDINNLQTELDNLQSQISDSSSSSHNHDDMYYTETEIDDMLGTQVTFSLDGTVLTITSK